MADTTLSRNAIVTTRDIDRPKYELRVRARYSHDVSLAAADCAPELTTCDVRDAGVPRHV